MRTDLTRRKGSMLRSILILLLAAALLLPGCIVFQITVPGTSASPDKAPEVLVFTNYPSTVNTGGATTLLWTVTGAASVNIEPGVGPVAAAGIKSVSPDRSTVYRLYASNARGAVTRSTSVTVNTASSSPFTFFQSPSPAPWSPNLNTFAVTGVVADTEPSGRTGCYTLFANISANGAGDVSYIWESTEGGGYSYTWTIRFNRAGTQKVTLPVEMSALPSGQYRLHVLTPNDIASNPTYYQTCR